MRGLVRAGLDEVERPVSDAALRQGLRVTQVGLAHLDKSSAVHQQAQRCVDELAGQRVQDQIHPGAGRTGAEGGLEIQAAGVADVIVIETHRAQRVPFTAAGGGEHLATPMACQLHRGHADPAGRRVHQHPLARFHLAKHRQPVPRGQERHRESGGLRSRPTRRDAGHQPAVDDRLGARHTQQPQYRVACGKIRDTRSHFDDDAGSSTPNSPPPGYMPSATSTSRKFTPTAATATRSAR